MFTQRNRHCPRQWQSGVMASAALENHWFGQFNCLGQGFLSHLSAVLTRQDYIGAPLFCTAVCCTVLYYTVLYCTVLYCTVLYCTVLYCTVLYCFVLFYIFLKCQSYKNNACHVHAHPSKKPSLVPSFPPLPSPLFPSPPFPSPPSHFLHQLLHQLRYHFFSTSREVLYMVATISSRPSIWYLSWVKFQVLFVI